MLKWLHSLATAISGKTGTLIASTQRLHMSIDADSRTKSPEVLIFLAPLAFALLVVIPALIGEFVWR